MVCLLCHQQVINMEYTMGQKAFAMPYVLSLEELVTISQYLEFCPF